MTADFVPLSSTTSNFFYKFEKEFLSNISK